MGCCYRQRSRASPFQTCCSLLVPVLEQRQERPLAPVDLGTVVSESALLDHAPLYLAAIVVCGAIVMWNNGMQEDARWRWQ